jgi:hypothetical protein
MRFTLLGRAYVNWFFYCRYTTKCLTSLFGGVSKSMLTLNKAIIDVKKG